MRLPGKAALAACLVFAAMSAQSSTRADDDAPATGTVQIVNAESNLLSQEIWGNWSVHEDFTKFVAEGRSKERGKVSIEKDAGSSERIKEMISEVIASGKERKHDGITKVVMEAAATLYCAGKFSVEQDGKRMDTAFALTSAHGTPLLILIHNNHLQASHISFVRDPDGDNDLLFLGGDRATEHFLCFKRAAKDEAAGEENK